MSVAWVIVHRATSGGDANICRWYASREAAEADMDGLCQHGFGHGEYWIEERPLTPPPHTSPYTAATPPASPSESDPT